MDGSLAALLQDVAAGRFPAADGSVTILPQPSERDAGVIDLPAHAVVFTGADPDWVRSQLRAGDLSAALSPRFLQALGAATAVAFRLSRESRKLDAPWRRHKCEDGQRERPAAGDR